MNKFDEELIKKYVPHNQIDKALQKLSKGYPVQYIIGNVEFYGNLINVNEKVLIPRFETEYLVQDLLKYIKEYDFKNPKILDIGTGSGCIAIALKKNVDSNVDALDISADALEVAKENAIFNNVNINFINQDIHEFKPDYKYDIIVSNPPYVSKDVMVDEKTKYEPQNAIFAGDNGLYFYKVILANSIHYLSKKNIIAFETGHNHALAITKICKDYYPNAKIITKSDLNGYDRYIYIIND
ncbi:MAG: peptide chain release factor N(5)-glutamine methyltransferase [Firmicutes bacterium]|nr:peptide chain release factor N(5)-glutamine methyltransferase [Bacillota bacterium]